MRGFNIFRFQGTEAQSRSGMARLLSRQSRSILSVSAAGALGLWLAACTNPGTRAIDAGVPLTSAPDLAGAAPMGTRVWRSPELSAAERAASAYQIPPATVF